MPSLGFVELTGSAARRQLARRAPSDVDHGGILSQNEAPTMRFASYVLSAFFCVATVTSCSASKASPPEYDDVDVAGRSVNPDGVAYPTDHIGGSARASGRPGNRIPNFTFMAYVDGDRSKGLQPVSLADYYDPTSKRAKILDLQVSATWCSFCSEVTKATVPVKESLAKDGAVFLEVVVGGASQTAGPSLDEVNGWLADHSSNVTTAIDVRAHRLGAVGVVATVVPFDILVDLRTMEMLDASGGAPQNFDISSYVHEGLRFVATHPPTY
jgi:hypothetical protein